MSITDIIRAWKDSSYRDSLSEEQQALLPENPIGEALSEEDLRSISGGRIDNTREVSDPSPCDTIDLPTC